MSKTEDKWQALGFKRKPFIDLSRHNPFLTAKQRQQLTLLEELVREGGHLVLLLGVSGVGKTTFLNAFKKNITLPTQQTVIGLCEMQGDEGVNIAMIKSLLAKHLTVTDTIHSDTFMQSLRARLAQLAQSNERFLLVIDDAHELPAETVRFLLDLMSELDETEHTLSILLAGRMQLEHLFTSSVTSDWSTGSSFTVVLEPLNEDEVLHYIKYGLRKAGYRGVMPFSKSQIIELSRESKGILARLLVMAVDILETKRRDMVKPRWMMYRRATFATMFALLSVVMVTLGYWYHASKSVTLEAALNTNNVISVEQEGPWVKTMSTPVVIDDTADKSPAVEASTQDQPVVASIPETTTHSVVMPSTAASITKMPVLPKATQVTSTSIPETIAPTTGEQPITTPVPDTEVSMAPQSIAPVVAKIPVQKTPSHKTAMTTYGYTIQIAGGYDLTTLQQTVCQLWTTRAMKNCTGLPDDLHYVHTVRNGKDWYIATIGQYSSSEAATRRLQQLSANVQKQTPWVRSLAQIEDFKLIE